MYPRRDWRLIVSSKNTGKVMQMELPKFRSKVPPAGFEFRTQDPLPVLLSNHWAAAHIWQQCDHSMWLTSVGRTASVILLYCVSRFLLSLSNDDTVVFIRSYRVFICFRGKRLWASYSLRRANCRINTRERLPRKQIKTLKSNLSFILRYLKVTASML